jgi:hypothetical protein
MQSIYEVTVQGILFYLFIEEIKVGNLFAMFQFGCYSILFHHLLYENFWTIHLFLINFASFIISSDSFNITCNQ